MLCIRGGVVITIANGTLLIVGFHNVFNRFLNKILYVENGGNLKSLLVAIIIMVVMYTLILLSKRYFPAILGYRK